ncbi:unnamed protein product [Effrenium voratum]|nr:unnamed protein product [Effrenium voratum]
MPPKQGGSTGMGKHAQVRNKSANPNQITAEQLLREAVDRQAAEAVAPRQRIADEDELMMYKVRKRKEYEDIIRRQRQNIGSWVKYAQWEASQQEYRRSRSIFERALHVEYQNVSLWLKYLEMEMKNKFVNHARNLFDRVVQLLPRVDQFWYKYAYMEELLANYAGARTIYERWMEWEPEDNPWLQYVKFEERCGELDKARKVLERYVSCRPTQQAFLRLCKFEEKHNNAARARSGFEKAVELLGNELDEKFYIKFALFEQRQREMERAQAIFKLALDILPKGASDELYRAYVSFEKQHGDRDAIEEVVINKRRYIYEDALSKNPRNYDVWFDYVRLEESVGDVTRIRETYERAIPHKPPVLQKRFWRRYIYLWIYYALFEAALTTLDDPAAGADDLSRALVACQRSRHWREALARLQLETTGPKPSVLGYNATISACARERHWQEALQILRFNSCLAALARAESAARAAWAQGVALLAEMPRAQVDPELLTHNTALRALRPRWRQVLELFASMRERDTVSYTAAINAAERSQHWQWVVQLLDDMRLERVAPDLICLAGGISAFARLQRWQEALRVLSADEFDVRPDLVCHNAGLTALAEGHQWQRAVALLARLRAAGRADVISFNAAITGCERALRWREALRLLEDIFEANLEPSATSFNAAASACETRWEEALALWARAPSRDVVTLAAVLSACDKAAAWQQALALTFDDPGPKNQITYCSLVSACLQASKWERAFDVWHRASDDVASVHVAPAAARQLMMESEQRCLWQRQAELLQHFANAFDRRGAGAVLCANALALAPQAPGRPAAGVANSLVRLVLELQTGDIEKARAVYDALLKAVPHKQFSFAKIWKLYAEFEVRQLELDRARRIYGRAIAECQKERIFLDYADLEMRLGNIDRCRTIYGKFLEVHPHNPKAWTVYVDLEDSVGEIERARALCNLAVNQERLDMPELVWKRFIDLEVSQEEFDNARKVWQQLVSKSHHVRVYIAYCDFEAVTCQSMAMAREGIEEGQKHFKVENRNEERAMLLEHLLKLEKEFGDEKSLQAAEGRQAQRVKKKRAIPAEEEGQEAFEEYMDYNFPEDSKEQQNLKILEMAHLWKKRKLETAQ